MGDNFRHELEKGFVNLLSKLFAILESEYLRERSLKK